MFGFFRVLDVRILYNWVLISHYYNEIVGNVILMLYIYTFWVQSFDRGYYLLVKSIQELRERKEGLVTVGIGGPSGSGKTR